MKKQIYAQPEAELLTVQSENNFLFSGNQATGSGENVNPGSGEEGW